MIGGKNCDKAKCFGTAEAADLRQYQVPDHFTLASSLVQTYCWPSVLPSVFSDTFWWQPDEGGQHIQFQGNDRHVNYMQVSKRNCLSWARENNEEEWLRMANVAQKQHTLVEMRSFVQGAQTNPVLVLLRLMPQPTFSSKGTTDFFIGWCRSKRVVDQPQFFIWMMQQT